MSQYDFSGLADLVPEAMLAVSTDGKILGANRAAAAYLDAASESLVDCLLADVVEKPPESLSDFLRACARSRDRVLNSFTFRLNGALKPSRVEGFLACPRSGTKPAEILLRIFPKEATTGKFLHLNERIDQLSREIAARKRVEDALRVQHELLRVTLASIGDAVITTDPDGRITFQNPVAEALTGWRSDEACGRPLEEVFRIVNEHTGDTVESPVRNVIREGRIVGLANHTVLIAKDRSEHPIDDSGAPIRDSGGALMGVVLVFRDVAERKEAEQQRENMLASERAARSQAERAGRMKDEFLATLSHELRTPLNAILGYASLLQLGRSSEIEIQESIETIARNARLQAQLIEDLLDMNRIISGKIRLEVQPVDLPNVIEAALETIKPSANAKELRVRKIFHQAAGVVRGDPNRLQQVVWNILSNAVKFTPKGGKIQVSLEQVKSHVEITIMDTGQGIPAEFLPFVFDRFSQVDSTSTRHHGGLGLGLSIVKQLVELHGGSIQVRSPGEGEGSTFVISLPMAAIHIDDGANPQAAAASKHLGGDCSPDLSGLRILVVDDERDACGLVVQVLANCKGEVDFATSADEGLRLVQSRYYHVLISDIGMPGKDGYAFIREVRALGAERGGGNIPALALTAFARTEDRQRAAMAGFQNHLAKPVEAMELLAVVANLAGRTGR